VADLITVFLDVENPGTPEATEVGRLATSCGIEEGVREDREGSSAFLPDGDDLCLELREISVPVIGKFDHGSTLRWATALGPSANP
jgi:hypothetical protein